MKIIASIEARMSSTRLPGKVILPVLNTTIIEYLILRLKKVKHLDGIVLATTLNSNDDILEQIAKKNGINCFRGSENDVMGRVILAGQSVNADLLVEITGDCPLIDPVIVDQTIEVFLNNNVDYVSNCNVRSYPDGMDTQVYKLETLKSSYAMNPSLLEKEHVTLHIRKNPHIFSKMDLIAQGDLFWPDLGLTLDEYDDYVLIEKIINHFGPGNMFYTCSDIVNVLIANREWIKINENIIRKGDN